MDAGEVVTDFERDPLGRMLSKISRAVTDTDGKTSERNRYSYDPAGRLTETYNGQQYLAFTYDRMGYLIKEHHSEKSHGQAQHKKIVNGGRPNYIYQNGRVVVVEKSGGQFRVRGVSGSMARNERREIKRSLNKFQRRGR